MNPSPIQQLDVADAFIHELYFHHKQKEIEPMIHLFMKDGRDCVVGLPFSSREEKWEMVEVLKRQFGGKIDHFLFICEAWQLLAPLDNPEAFINQAFAEYDSLGNHPERIESVSIMYENSKQILLRSYTIERDENGMVKELIKQDDKYDSMKDNLFAGLVVV